MLFSDLVATSVSVSATRSRTTKRDLLAATLSRCSAEEVEVAVAYLSGETRQRRTGVGWRSLTETVDPEVIGGLRVNVGDRVLDGTLRRSLQDMRRSFAATQLQG